MTSEQDLDEWFFSLACATAYDGPEDYKEHCRDNIKRLSKIVLEERRESDFYG